MVTKPLLRWLLHSRRRFLAVVLGCLLAILVVSQLGSLTAAVRIAVAPAAPPPATTAAPAPPTSATPLLPAPSEQQPPPASPPSPSSSPSSDESEGPQAVAVRFARLWAAPDLPRSQWLRRLQPLATEEYGQVVLPQVNPANVPATQVTGPARTLSQGQGVASIAVPMDGGLTIGIALVDVGQGTWRVSDVQPLMGA